MVPEGRAWSWTRRPAESRISLGPPRRCRTILRPTSIPYSSVFRIRRGRHPLRGGHRRPQSVCTVLDDGVGVASRYGTGL
jgi:hypothetical protein